MRIRTLFFVGVVVSAGALAGASAGLVGSLRSVDQALRADRTASEVTRAAFELSILTSEYLLHRTQRPRTQWDRKHRSLGALLDGWAPKSDDAVSIRNSVRKNHVTMERLFGRLVDVRSGTQESALPDAVADRLESRLATQLSSTAQSMFLAAKVARGLKAELVRARTAEVRDLFIAAVTITTVIALVAWLLLVRRVFVPLDTVGAGIRAFAGGDLGHRIPVPKRDEIGAVASALNDMAGRLEKTTVSRDRLAREVVRRSRAERESAAANTALARSNSELQQFAYVASHDLQEPLRAVSSYAELLAKRYGDALDERARTYIRHCVEGSRRMSQMIDALLAYSRVGTRGGAFEEVETAAVVDAALQNLAAAIRESGAVVTTSELPRVVADGDQLLRAFQNLIGNAVKFRNAAAPEIHVSAERLDDGWEFSVRDNGIGIDPKFADRIFTIFQRLHHRDEYPGSGIGLSVCKRIVERHGGAIRVASEPGAGADFRFTIPDRRENADAA